MPPSVPLVADELDELFTLPPSEFTAARDALAKRLRADGRAEEAAQVKKVRRPTVPAWAINQVARRHPDALAELIEAGSAVAAAQRKALSGVRDSGLRDASHRRRELIDQVWKAAAKLLRDAGVEPTPHRQAVADTLEAASLDEGAAAEVTAGRLSAQLPPPSGFGAVAGLSLVPSEAADEPQPEATEETDPDAEDRARREALAEAKRLVEEHERAAATLERRAGDARQAALRKTAEAERLDARARDVREKADALQAEAEQLTAQADEARAAAEDAERLRRKLEQA
jgi:hypothetical protein